MRFEVDTQILAEDVAAIENDIKMLRKRGKAVNDAFESLSAMWMGEAHDSFSVQFKNDYAFLCGFFNSLEAEKDGISGSRANYDSCEASVKSRIAEVMI